MGNSTPYKIETHENIILKLCIRDYVSEMTHRAILVSIGAVVASPKIGEILPSCDFFNCPVLSLPFFSRSYAQVEPLDRFSHFMARTTCFHSRMVLMGVRTIGDHIWGKYTPTTPKIGMNRQFQAKTARYENRNISKNRIKTKFEDQAETDNCTSLVV